MLRGVPFVVMFVVLGGGILLAALLLPRWLRTLAVEPTVSPQDVEASKATAKSVIAAVEAFRARVGRLPQHLGGLVPEYLPSLPEPRMPYREWIYMIDENDPRRYSLGFATSFRGKHVWWWLSGAPGANEGQWSEVEIPN